METEGNEGGGRILPGDNIGDEAGIQLPIRVQDPRY